MLPDDYENLAQSVIATNIFGNNILQAITTKNYWDVVNEYKPLMHTWYVGLLMQYYVLFALILFLIGRVIKDSIKRNIVNLVSVSVIGLISLMLYLVCDNTAAKFYYLPFRLFEFCAGSFVFYFFNMHSVNYRKNSVNVTYVLAFISIIVLLFLNFDYISRLVKLIATVLLTSILIALIPFAEVSKNYVFSNKWIAMIGAASFSVFVWHQIVFAIVRYSFTNNMTDVVVLCVIVTLIVVLSVLSYRFVEQMKKTKLACIVVGILLVLTTGFSFYIFDNAGVVRDVPELEVYKGAVNKGMWAEYCDRGYEYDKEFAHEDKLKWYVIGNSFGRDMVNIILESSIADSVDVVYSDMLSYKEGSDRFELADIVFLSTLGIDEQTIETIQSYCGSDTKFYVIGEKNFGENNGQIYRKRFHRDYHSLTVSMEDGYAAKNSRLKEKFPHIYIDMIAPVQHQDGSVRVFSDDGKFISQDCRHLTRAGAQYYASIIDWERFM